MLLIVSLRVYVVISNKSVLSCNLLIFLYALRKQRKEGQLHAETEDVFPR